MKVLLTGATGFLGAHVVEALLAAGHEVRALVRRSSDTTRLQARGVALSVGALDAGEGLDEALAGVEAVAHLAGGGKVRRTRDIYAGNVDTTEHLLAAVARRAPDLARFVHVSSLAAHGPSPDGRPRDPDAPPAPVTHYGRAKAQAEAAVLARRDTFPVTIIRPPAVYGPGDTRMLGLYRVIDRLGVAPLPGRDHTASLIYGPDCAAAIVAALADRRPVSGRAYFVEDGAPRAQAEIGRLIGAALGRSVRLVPVPGVALTLLGALNDGLGRLTGRAVALGRDKVRDLAQPHWICSAAPIRAELGWAPTVAFPEGAQRTARWYRERGWLG
jgi:nucleoside-diphosphate-sugar epimerase